MKLIEFNAFNKLNMTKFKNKYILILILFFSCKAIHNVPSDEIYPNSLNKINNETTIFVDQNGDFYPDNWREKYDKPPRNGNKYAYSLRTMALRKSRDEFNQLKKFQNTFLKRFKSKIKSKKRIIFLVHGYNTSEKKANKTYDRIIKKLDLTKDDEVVKFFWDGLISKNLGSLGIWFNAAGYSQLAGEFGLRKVLETLQDKNVYFISHSRGASVILSALSSPPYKDKFKNETLKEHSLDINNSIPLNNNNNNFYCLFLAPAIGRIDFQTPDKKDYRSLGKQVKTIHITINKGDRVLKKIILGLGGKYNPTDLGSDIRQYEMLKDKYPFLKGHTIFLKSHSFNEYIKEDIFDSIISKFNLLYENK